MLEKELGFDIFVREGSTLPPLTKTGQRLLRLTQQQYSMCLAEPPLNAPGRAQFPMPRAEITTNESLNF